MFVQCLILIITIIIFVCILKYVDEYGYFVLVIDIVTNRGISIVTFP